MEISQVLAAADPEKEEEEGPLKSPQPLSREAGQAGRKGFSRLQVGRERVNFGELEKGRRMHGGTPLPAREEKRQEREGLAAAARGFLAETVVRNTPGQWFPSCGS